MIQAYKIILSTILFCFITSFCAAGDIASIRIDKVQVAWPEAKLYFDILDSQGHPEKNTIPNDFTAIVGTSRADIKQIKPFTASGEGIAYTLLLDVSSISPENFDQTKQLLASAVDKLSANDQACIMTFGNKVTICQRFTANKKALKDKLAALSPIDNQARLYQGLAEAIKISNTVDEDLPARRAVIIVFGGANDAADTVTPKGILEILRVERLPIYAVGYASPLRIGETQVNFNTLGELARYSGGAYYQNQSAPLSAIYADIFKTSKSGFVAYLTCPPLTNGSGLYKIQLALKNDEKMFTDTIESTIIPDAAPIASKPNTATPEKAQMLYLYLLVLVISLLLLLIALKLHKRKKLPNSPATKQTSSPEPYANTQTAATAEQAINKKPADSTYWPPMYRHTSPQCLNLLLTTQTCPSKTFPLYLSDMILIGSGTDSNLILANDNTISAMHCKLSQQNGKLYIADLGSANGTFVNGIPIKTRLQLHDGDMLCIGKTELLVTF